MGYVAVTTVVQQEWAESAGLKFCGIRHVDGQQWQEWEGNTSGLIDIDSWGASIYDTADEYRAAIGENSTLENGQQQDT